jgi:hypothetical protein
MSPSTNVTCSSNGTASIGSLEVLSIDVPAGKIRVKSPVNSWCYNTTTHSMGEQNTWIYDTSETAFRVSDTDNKLTVVGCNVLAYVWSRDGGADDKYIVGCNATCSRGMESLAPLQRRGRLLPGADQTGNVLRTDIRRRLRYQLRRRKVQAGELVRLGHVGGD